MGQARAHLLTLTALAALASAAGCAANAVVGQASPQRAKYQGDLGIAGHGSDVTLLAGSRVPKLSIVGDNCKVVIEDGATVGRIEFWGNGSTVSVPADLDVTTAIVGTNQIVRRGVPPGSPATP